MKSREYVGSNAKVAQLFGQLKKVDVHSPGVLLSQAGEGTTVNADQGYAQFVLGHGQEQSEQSINGEPALTLG